MSTIDYSGDGRFGAPEQDREGIASNTQAVQPPHIEHLMFTQLRPPVFRTLLRYLPKDIVGMLVVLAGRHPFEVLYEVVQTVPVFVVALLTRGAGADECRQHESMHGNKSWSHSTPETTIKPDSAIVRSGIAVDPQDAASYSIAHAPLVADVVQSAAGAPFFGCHAWSLAP